MNVFDWASIKKRQDAIRSEGKSAAMSGTARPVCPYSEKLAQAAWWAGYQSVASKQHGAP